MIQPRQITHAAPGWIANEYSSVCPFSKGNAYLLVIAHDHFQLFTGDGQPLDDLPIGASERPRWSRRGSSLLTYLRGNRVIVHDVIVGELDSFTFPEYVSLDDLGEADQQGDSRVLVGVRPDGTKEIFVFDVVSGTKGPVLSTTGPFNNVLLCPDGEILINGKLLIDPATKFGRVIAGSDSHKAVGRDLDGKAILVRDNSDDPINPENEHRIMKVPLDGSEPTVLATLPWAVATHISLCDKFALVTTFSPTDPMSDGAHNAILKVPLDGPDVQVLCCHGSHASTYTAQPKASVSLDGSRFVFASNGGDLNGPVNTFIGVLAVPTEPLPPSSPGHPYPNELKPRKGLLGRLWGWLRGLFRTISDELLAVLFTLWLLTNPYGAHRNR